MLRTPKSPPPKTGKGSRAVRSLQPEAQAGEPEEYVTTAIHLPRYVLRILREVAIARADVAGGRPSVSAVLTDLVRANRDALAREAGR